MTADKPEAGRTCAVWCGTERDDPGCFNYCTNECGRAGRPMNPAPRPVESHESLALGYALQGMDFGVESPRPAERCSCSEATRYKAALEEIAAYVSNKRLAGIRLEEIDGLARRALALGEENDNERR